MGQHELYELLSKNKGNRYTIKELIQMYRETYETTSCEKRMNGWARKLLRYNMIERDTKYNGNNHPIAVYGCKM